MPADAGTRVALVIGNSAYQSVPYLPNPVLSVGFSNADADKWKNIQLMKDRAWLDVPMVYANERRAILAIEKGEPGERVYTQAFASWGQ
jgi:hypothetical protein